MPHRAGSQPTRAGEGNRSRLKALTSRSCSGLSTTLGGLDLAEVSAVLVVEASRHSAAEFQPVLLELSHACPFSVAWPGGLPCPWNRGTVDTEACQQSTRGKRWSQRSRPCTKIGDHGSAQVPGWLAECLRLGVGHASTVRPDPSTLGAVGERGSHYEGCLLPVAG
jgi:hypothetical protein